jgi:hypothetical protein
MQATLKLNTVVLPGHRIEVVAPELPEGARVELTVVLPEIAAKGMKPDESPKVYGSMIEFLDALPPGPTPRLFPTWEEYEKFLQEEKDAWER